MKVIYFLLMVLFIGIVIFLLLPSYPSRDLNSAAHSIEENILLFQKLIFSDTPPQKEEMNSCIYLFNGSDDKISENIRMHYNIPQNFEYSLVGLLLQDKKEIFSLLRRNYNIVVAWRYTKTPTKYHTIPYVRIVPEGSWRGISSENLLFPTSLVSGVLHVEKIQINNIPLQDLLEISPDGKILNQETEKKFLENVAKLSRQEPSV